MQLPLKSIFLFGASLFWYFAAAEAGVFNSIASVLNGDFELRGRIHVDGSTGYQGDMNAAITAQPINQSMIGVFGQSELSGVLGITFDGHGVTGTTVGNGVGVEGFALFGGTAISAQAPLGSVALDIGGSIRKKNAADDRIVVFDPISNEELGRFRYSFQ